MRKKFTLLSTALAVAAVGIGASTASAATLYTTAAHTTAVSVGTSFTLTAASTPTTGAFDVFDIPGGGWIVTCPAASLDVQVAQNSAGTFKANVIHNNFVTCSGFDAPFSSYTAGTVNITSSSVANGTNTAWLGTSLVGLRFTPASGSGLGTGTENFTGATGSPPVNGAFAQQPTAAKAPVSVVLNNAATWTHPIGVTGRVRANYTFSGAAASYSLG